VREMKKVPGFDSQPGKTLKLIIIVIRFLLQTSELGVTEHIEGDECKFAVWTGRSPMPENKIILKVIWGRGSLNEPISRV
jgi:hypothetical protein